MRIRVRKKRERISCPSCMTDIEILSGGVANYILVWEKAHGPIPAGHVVHHKNEDRADNRLRNLRLMTASEHAVHHNSVRGPLSESHKRNISKSLTGKPSFIRTAEMRRNMSRGQRGRILSPEHRAKISASMRRTLARKKVGTSP